MELLGEYDAALLLFAAERMLQKDPLISHYFGSQTDQSAMGADHQGMSPFAKG
jgi:hypothetical protein